MAESNSSSGMWVRLFAFGILAAIGLLCLVVGGMVFWMSVEVWFQGGDDLKDAISWVFGLMSAGVVAIGLMFGGLALRFLPWRGAPLLSLLLALLSAGFVILTYTIFADTGRTRDSVEIIFLQVSCALAMIMVVLPPFLHWLLARPKPVGVANVPGDSAKGP